jgi:Glycosyltransferase family 87
MGHGWPFVDLSVYREGGEATLSGRDLYALRFPGALAFTYPPPSALLFTALVPWRMAVLEPLVTAASMLLLPVTLALALRLPPARTCLTRGRAVCLALLASAGPLWLEPVWTTIRYGQIDLLIAALVLYDLSRDRACRWQGAAIGLAAGLKLTPAIFALYLYLLLTRRCRAALVSLAAFAITASRDLVGARQPPVAFRASPRRAAAHLRRRLRAGRGARPGARGLVGCSPCLRAGAARGPMALLACLGAGGADAGAIDANFRGHGKDLGTRYRDEGHGGTHGAARERASARQRRARASHRHTQAAAGPRARAPV